MNIIIKQSANKNLTPVLYNKVIQEVSKSGKKKGLIENINYIIKSKSIILF